MLAVLRSGVDPPARGDYSRTFAVMLLISEETCKAYHGLQAIHADV